MRIDASTPAVALQVHHGTLGIARSLGRLGVPVTVVDGNVDNPVFRSRYVREALE